VASILTEDRKEEIILNNQISKAKKFVKEHNINAEGERRIVNVYKKYYQNLEGTLEPELQKQLTKRFKNRRNKLAILYSDSININKFTTLKNNEFLMYSNKLELSTDQKEQWVKYYFNYKDTVKTLERKSVHYPFIEQILTSEQFNKYLSTISNRAAREKTKQTVENLKAQNITIEDDEKDMLFRYHRAICIAQLRYKNQLSKKEEVISNIKKTKGQRVSYLLAQANHAKKGKSIKGTYQW